MSDPLDILPSGKRGRPDPPDSPKSVGWTRTQRVRLADDSRPLELDCGEAFSPIDVEFETYGELSPAKDNAVLIAHALSGDAHAAGWCSDADRDERPWRRKRPGWWDLMIGPGKPFDTNKYFVICSNILGSCYGTTGPASTDPKTGRPYASSFPVITVGDWVRLQERLITHLRIDRLLTVSGGSLGGQQAMEWALSFPERVRSVIVLAATPHLMAQGLAFNYAARHAIQSDPHFNEGNYYGGRGPDEGLAVARMIGHITYLSDVSMTKKFGRRLQNGEPRGPQFSREPQYQVESYLRYQGESFVQRFDGNAYLTITRAMDYYDAGEHGDGDLTAAMKRADCEWLLTSFSSDWLYPPEGTLELVKALARNLMPVTYINLDSPYGHDAFLLETERLTPLISNFLNRLVRRIHANDDT